MNVFFVSIHRVGSLSQKITNQLLGLKGLNAQLRDIKKYLIKVSIPLKWLTSDNSTFYMFWWHFKTIAFPYVYSHQVGNGELPLNHQIVYQLQDILNLLPDVTTDNFTETMYVKTNDQMLVVYLASMVRSIIALHNLINNKLTNRDAEEGKKDEGKDKKDKDNKDSKDGKKDDKEAATNGTAKKDEKTDKTKDEKKK